MQINEIGENLTPSIVSFVDEGILVGEQTLNQLIKNPKKTIYSIKRLMGRNYNDKEVLNDIKSNFWTFDVVEQKIIDFGCSKNIDCLTLLQKN